MDLNQQIQGLKDAHKRRQQALKMHTEQNKSLKEIGDHFGVTRERARQMVAKAIKENAG